MLLRNKVAVISGCNRGIGKAILETFAENGANVFACVRKKTDEFLDLVGVLTENTGVSITPVYFDLLDVEQIQKGINQIKSSKNPVDILVNNAGVASGSLLQMTSLEDLKNIFEINFFSQILFTQGISRYMSRFNSGSIINIASTAGMIGDAGTTSYGSSKAALILATKALSTELGAKNIRVNAISPSITQTDMFNQMDERTRNKIIIASALKRPATAVEVANVALFLASDLSSFITGQVLRVDGGLKT
jgi:3-oxoacyl-[acyl-carrier protein] reductase